MPPVVIVGRFRYINAKIMLTNQCDVCLITLKMVRAGRLELPRPKAHGF